MNIDKITITNFRNIEKEITFQFNQKFTTIIGINGKGKSTILHAIRIAAGAYLLGIPEAAKRHIWESEIRLKDFEKHLARQTPTTIKAEGSIDGKKLTMPWIRQIPEGMTKTTSNAEDVGEIRNLARTKYDLVTKDGVSNVDNPVIAYFGTGRLYGSSRNTLGPFIGRQIFKYGYYSWLEMQYSTYQYSYWLKSHRFLVSDNKDSSETSIAFFDTIRSANPYIKALDFDGTELVLKVKMNEDEPESQFLPLSLHSDGIITHTAMVAELAFRCIMLNAHYKIDAVKKSKGVVMIDELDLHLHPTWQRHIVADLKKAFPCIQFVATTHSPFIVQSLNSNELINLDLGTDISPKELSLEIVAEEIMNVKSSFSEENNTEENLSLDYFTLLAEAEKSPRKDFYVAKLKAFENAIDDAGLRAFLKSNRIAKNIL